MDQAAEAAALEAGWQFLCREQGDVPFAAVVAIVQARCSRVGVERSAVRL